MRHATRWSIVSVAGGLLAGFAWAKAPRKPPAQEPPELRLRAREVIQGQDGQPAVRITLKDLGFTRSRLRELGPVEAPLGVRPP